VVSYILARGAAESRPPRKRRVKVTRRRVCQTQKGDQVGREVRAWARTLSVSEVIIREGDNFESALKKFTRRVQQDGLLSEAKRRQHYEPPSVKRKRKADARERKARKARAKAAAMGY
jgi:small subunit ribosomal protein S21